MKLAILIPTLTVRKPLLNRLMTELIRQINLLDDPNSVKLIVIEDAGEQTTGWKRNRAIEKAVEMKAEYIAFIDDDDLPGDNYIARMMEGIATGADCCSLWGQIYWDGIPGKPFWHSIENTHWWEDATRYYRNTNHLNCIKLDLVKDIKFPDQVFGEDGKWSEALHASGRLKTEFKIDEVIYHYFCGQPKHAI